jgi:type IV secretion system protein VirD4
MTPALAAKAATQSIPIVERVVPLPQPGGTPAPVAADEWSALPLRRPPEAQAAQVHQEGEDTANSGLRREPDLPEHGR